MEHEKFNYWRQRVIISSFCGYVLFYFLRKSFIFVMPYMSKELCLNSSSIGLLSTALYVTYGFSKVFNSFLADILNPRYFMLTGLLLTSIFTFCLGFTHSFFTLLFFCCLNGWFQGFGWPAVTKQLTHWFDKRERGFWWGICSTSHTIGGALSALICGYLATHFDWRFAIYVPSFVCLLLCFILLERLRGTPKSLNLPSAVEHYNQQKKIKTKEKLPRRTKKIYINQIIKNEFIWILSLSYLLTYVVKTAINDWIVLYLVKQKNYTLGEACSCMFWFEVGGFFGICATSKLIDSILQTKKILFLLIIYFLLITTLILLYVLPKISLQTTTVLLTITGFLIFSPQMLIGLLAAESTSTNIACAANGFVGGWAYVGAAIAGYPLGLLINISWDSLFLFTIICAILAVCPLFFVFKN